MTLYDVLELSLEEVRDFRWGGDGAEEEYGEEPEEGPEEGPEGDHLFLALASRNLSKPSSRRTGGGDSRQFVVVALLLVRGKDKYVLSVAAL